MTIVSVIIPYFQERAGILHRCLTSVFGGIVYRNDTGQKEKGRHEWHYHWKVLRTRLNRLSVSVLAASLIGIVFGVYTAFHDPDLTLEFSSKFEWFLTFAQTVFEPQTVYYAESFLHPLLAHLSGATSSIETFKAFCLVLNIAGIVITCIAAAMRFRSLVATSVFCVMLLWSFSYYSMSFSILGYPDPLTMMFLSLAGLAESPIFLALSMLGACLSHFSLAVVATLGLIALQLADRDEAPEIRKHKLVALALAPLAGKLLLALWFLVFHYHPEYSRLDYVFQHGWRYFYDHWRNYDDLVSFLLTPGEPMLYCVGGVFAFFLIRLRYLTCIALLLAMLFSYIALFFTVDGIRIFAVAFLGSYVFALSRAISIIFSSTKHLNRIVSGLRRSAYSTKEMHQSSDVPVSPSS